MTRRAVLVLHSQALIGESIAVALDRYPDIAVVGTFISARDAEVNAARVDAAAIDAELPAAHDVALRFGRRGIRVVMIGETGHEGGAEVPTSAPVRTLAAALAPDALLDGATRAALTRRQQQILELVAHGLAAKQVARQLGISPKTVEQHKTKIFSKLGVPNQAAAVRVALATGTQGSH